MEFKGYLYYKNEFQRTIFLAISRQIRICET
ncbi:hypothetical protein T09_3040 [Trichinella sp. T9]|nr:hypothetical protein T09_3040 [Trichinella sp. T9]